MKALQRTMAAVTIAASTLATAAEAITIRASDFAVGTYSSLCTSFANSNNLCITTNTGDIEVKDFGGFVGITGTTHGSTLSLDEDTSDGSDGVFSVSRIEEKRDGSDGDLLRVYTNFQPGQSPSVFFPNYPDGENTLEVLFADPDHTRIQASAINSSGDNNLRGGWTEIDFNQEFKDVSSVPVPAAGLLMAGGLAALGAAGGVANRRRQRGLNNG